MKKIILILLSLTIFSCLKKKEEKHFTLLEKANWFIGNWENKSKEGNLSENWKKLSDSTFTGESFIIQGKDTVFHENMVLEQRSDSLFYDVSVKGQEETYFYLTHSKKDELTFENPKHDFPTKIIYKLVSPDSILASIHGKVKGKEKSEIFPMQRRK